LESGVFQISRISNCCILHHVEEFILRRVTPGQHFDVDVTIVTFLITV
jgi:hypothetical protein